jgi:Glycosyltransferase
MRILFISTMGGQPWGGSEELWFGAAMEAIQRNHTVVVSVFDWQPVPEKIKKLENAGAKIMRQAVPTTDRKTSLTRKIKTRLHLERDNYDVLAGIEVDVICVSQGSLFDLLSLPGYRKMIQTGNIPYGLILQHNVETGVSMSRERRAMAKKVFLQASGLFFVSQRNLEVTERQLATALPQAVVVSNPLNMSNRDIVSWPATDKIKMACVARHDVRYKGQDVLLKALSTETWRTRNYMLTLFGSGADTDYLKELIDFYRLSGKVVFGGHVHDIAAIWTENHLLVLPSHSEGTPLSLLEAQICGRPAIGTDVGDMGRFILEGQTGFLSPCSNVQYLSEALERMWDNRHRLEQMGTEARCHVLQLINPNPGANLLDHLEKMATK